MGGSTGFTAAGYHLVERAAMRELRVEFPAEFTESAGACVEAADNGWVDVFHGRAGSWERRKLIRPVVRQSHNTRLVIFIHCSTPPLYHPR